MNKLRDDLMAILAQMYELPAFNSLAAFLQGELHVLQYLETHRHEEVGPSVLSAKLHVSRSRITAALSALRKKGFVVMEITPEDRRRMRVILTPSGVSFLSSKRQRVESYFDRLVEGLGQENVLELMRLIELSINVMDDDAGEDADSKEQWQ